MGIWSRRNPISPRTKSLPPTGKLIPMMRARQIGHRDVFTRMVEDSRRLGATEIFIGCDKAESFHFTANSQTYTGVLPKGVVKELERVPRERFPLRLDWMETEVGDLSVGITTTGEVPVYCFSWNEQNKSKPQAIESLPTITKGESTETPLILIVDDDPRFSKILSRILECQHFKTLTASNGKEGLCVIEEFSPSVIITDIHMPKLSGPEFLLEIQKLGSQTPCLVLTNDEDVLTEAEMILLGASAFIRKSEDPRVLLAWCKRLTTLRRVA